MINALRYSLLVFFHPVDTFLLIKRKRSRITLIPAAVILVLLVAVRIGYIYIVHFPLADVLPMDANMLIEVGKILLPMVTLIISAYGITAILDGETTLKETATIFSYCTLPYVVFSIPIALITRMLSLSDAFVFNALNLIVFLWMFALFITALKVSNDYSMRKTLFTGFLVIVGMILIWCVFLLLAALTVQFFKFIEKLLDEYKILYLN